jgi:hypothetical protein
VGVCAPVKSPHQCTPVPTSPLLTAAEQSGAVVMLGEATAQLSSPSLSSPRLTLSCPHLSSPGSPVLTCADLG